MTKYTYNKIHMYLDDWKMNILPNILWNIFARSSVFILTNSYQQSSGRHKLFQHIYSDFCLFYYFY